MFLPLYQQSNVLVNVFEWASNVYFFIKKMLKIPKISEAVNRRGTYNTIVKKEKKTEKQQNDKQWSTKTLHRKLNIEQHEPY